MTAIMKHGNLTLTCDESGMPYTRTGPSGMFCSADVCKCEVESEKLFSGVDPDDKGAMLDALFGGFGVPRPE